MLLRDVPLDSEREIVFGRIEFGWVVLQGFRYGNILPFNSENFVFKGHSHQSIFFKFYFCCFFNSASPSTIVTQRPYFFLLYAITKMHLLIHGELSSIYVSIGSIFLLLGPKLGEHWAWVNVGQMIMQYWLPSQCHYKWKAKIGFDNQCWANICMVSGFTLYSLVSAKGKYHFPPKDPT